MRIETASLIHHPRDVVYRAYRDELPKIADYIPDVREIRVESRREEDGVVHAHNVWISERDVPAVARAVIKPHMLAWDDYAEWEESAWEVRWRIATRFFTEHVRCSGVNRFHVVDDRTTRLEVTGDFSIDLEEIPGLPRFVARSVRPKVEEFIVSVIKPNLERTNASVQQYLDER